MCIIVPLKLNLGNPRDAGSVKSFNPYLDATYMVVTYLCEENKMKSKKRDLADGLLKQKTCFTIAVILRCIFFIFSVSK